MTQAKKLNLEIKSNFTVLEKDQIAALCKQFGLTVADLDRLEKERAGIKTPKKRPKDREKRGGAQTQAAQSHDKKPKQGQPPIQPKQPEGKKPQQKDSDKKDDSASPQRQSQQPQRAPQQPQRSPQPPRPPRPGGAPQQPKPQQPQVLPQQKTQQPSKYQQSDFGKPSFDSSKPQRKGFIPSKWAVASRRTSTDTAIVAGEIAGDAQKGESGEAQGRLTRSEYRRRKRMRRAKRVLDPVIEEQRLLAAKKEVELIMPVNVRTLSTAIGVKTSDIMTFLMKNKIMVTLNEALPEDIVGLIAIEFGKEVKFRRERDLEEDLQTEMEEQDLKEEKDGMSIIRAPIVAFLGHVDHGKTSLLDVIRKANVAAQEHGGITQHIGSYKVNTTHGDVVFLDTPGHEAFTAMRARGAQVTDIVVLVVAADDGVMPQTEEALAHARAAGTPIVVAINKIDKPNANPDRVRRQLSERGLMPEAWGGDTIFVEVSAATKEGVPHMIEMLALQAEILELNAYPDRKAVGTVLEARISEGRGIVTDILVQDGTLRKGDVILCSHGFGRVRGLYNDFGQEIEIAGPSSPVEVTGLSEVPSTGDRFYVLDDFHKAKEIAHQREQRRREASLMQRAHISLENLFSRIAEGKVQELRVIIKADVQGSVEVLCDSINSITSNEVKVNILHRGVGGVNESDVLLADASDAIIIGYHVQAEVKAKQLAEQKGVEIRYYSIIFEAIAEIKKALEGLLEPEKKEKIIGHVDIRQVFSISRLGKIAGCQVADGIVTRNCHVRIFRAGAVIFTGKLSSLKRVKDDAKEVKEGFECGLKFEGFDDIEIGDRVECFVIEEIARKLT